MPKPNVNVNVKIKKNPNVNVRMSKYLLFDSYKNMCVLPNSKGLTWAL